MGKKTETSKPAATPPPAVSAVPAKKSTVKSPATAAKKPAAKKPAFTQDDVALRAYFISEKRHKAGLPGNAHHDWVEAERQLTAESKKKTAAKKA